MRFPKSSQYASWPGSWRSASLIEPIACSRACTLCASATSATDNVSVADKASLGRRQEHCTRETVQCSRKVGPCTASDVLVRCIKHHSQLVQVDADVSSLKGDRPSTAPASFSCVTMLIEEAWHPSELGSKLEQRLEPSKPVFLQECSLMKLAKVAQVEDGIGNDLPCRPEVDGHVAAMLLAMFEWRYTPRSRPFPRSL